MAEVYQEQQEQENLSGADLAEAWYEHNRKLLNEFEAITKAIMVKPSNTAADGISTKTQLEKELSWNKT